MVSTGRVQRERFCDISFMPVKMVIHVEKQLTDNLKTNTWRTMTHEVSVKKKKKRTQSGQFRNKIKERENLVKELR